MLPILQREVVERKKWMSQERIVDYYAISQGLPGIIAINVAIFIGKERKGVIGGITAALGIVGPCLFIITLIAAFLKNFQTNPIVRNAFAGIAIGVAALILDAVIGLWKKAVKNWYGIAIFGAVFLGMILTNITPVAFILCAAVIGIAAKRLIREGE